MNAQVDTPTRLYKAIRPDGTSFYDQATRWVVGEVTSHPHPTRVGKNDASGYLSTSDAATSCTGFSWPCRLLVVEPVGAVWQPNPECLPHKWAGHAFLVTEELPAHQVFGPQGEHVAALIERVGTLTRQETDSLVAARDAAWGAAWVTAREAAWEARRSAWVAAWVAARDAVCDAVGALVVRDLITTEDYNTLTLPWRRVIGRIYPDDQEVES